MDIYVPKICSIYNVFRQMVSTWFSKYDAKNINRLVYLPRRRGCPCFIRM